EERKDVGAISDTGPIPRRRWTVVGCGGVKVDHHQASRPGGDAVVGFWPLPPPGTNLNRVGGGGLLPVTHERRFLRARGEREDGPSSAGGGQSVVNGCEIHGSFWIGNGPPGPARRAAVAFVGQWLLWG